MEIGTIDLITGAPVLGRPGAYFSAAGASLQPEEALRQIIADDPASTNLISSRFYSTQAKYKDSYPLVLYSRVDGEYLSTIATTATNNMATVTIQLDIFGKGYAVAKQVADALRSALHTYSGTVTVGTDTIVINRINIISDFDGFDNPINGRTNGINRVIQQYAVSFNNQ